MKVKITFLSLYLCLCLVKSGETILWVNNFSEAGDSDYFGGARNLGANWSLTNIDIAPVTHTAEATPKAGYIAAATGQYSTVVVTEGDWGAYNGQYLSLYIWGNGNGSQTLTIEIIEEDEVAGAIVNETWSTGATSLSWTGWRYKMFKIPDNFVDSGGNGSWDPDYVAADPGPPIVLECRGVKQINFDANADIYIDEVVISNAGSTDAWVREIFPAISDSEPNNIDATLSELPVSISVVLGINASFTNSNNKIVVVEEDPTDNDPSYPTDNLCEAIAVGAPDFGASDGVGGWIVTPSDMESAVDLSSYVFGAPHVYTIFIRPVNSSGEPGKCEVITFTTFAPSPSTIQKLYKRSLIN